MGHSGFKGQAQGRSLRGNASTTSSLYTINFGQPSLLRPSAFIVLAHFANWQHCQARRMVNKTNRGYLWVSSTRSQTQDGRLKWSILVLSLLAVRAAFLRGSCMPATSLNSQEVQDSTGMLTSGSIQPTDVCGMNGKLKNRYAPSLLLWPAQEQGPVE